ncbi:MAG TPA: DUF5715 family protein, partial [Longimicrobium sp.]|nr:DUF5715 family protein [Longimicrobium sp.]
RAQALRGSRASVERMYAQARTQDLTFYRTSSGVRAAADRGDLVRLNSGTDYRLSGVSNPSVLRSTRTFVQRLAAQYRAECGERLVVTSAMRPSSVRLINSADKSVHPTGMAVDIRRPTGRRCLAWLRETLLYLEGQGVIEATEERRPPHFHVAVYPSQYRRYVNNAGDRDEDDAPRPGPERRTAQRSANNNPSTYRVRQGDSLWTIARRHGTSVSRLKAANDMQSSRIRPGQVLIIPGR